MGADQQGSKPGTKKRGRDKRAPKKPGADRNHRKPSPLGTKQAGRATPSTSKRPRVFGPAELSRLRGDCYILAEDPACPLQQPWPGRGETPVETRPPCLGLLRFSDVPGQRETPVQGLGFPDGPVPNDGERL